MRQIDQMLLPIDTPQSPLMSATSLFPSPQQVVDTDIATLKTAGLSTRKAEYGQQSDCYWLKMLY
jgi:DNA-3-methyladenine glycosylase II